MRRWLATIVFALSGSLVLSACGSPCDQASSCSVEGQPPNVTVCDGRNFRACDSGDRGLIIYCRKGAMAAECTPDGWTFVNVPASN